MDRSLRSVVIYARSIRHVSSRSNSSASTSLWRFDYLSVHVLPHQCGLHFTITEGKFLQQKQQNDFKELKIEWQHFFTWWDDYINFREI